MRIIGVIPARYKSTRLPEKPLADINGKPMIWWTYNQALKSKELDDVLVAIDDKNVEDACIKLGIKYIQTSDSHSTGVERLSEVALNVEADIYILIQGDEPLIDPSAIDDMVRRVRNSPENRDKVHTFRTPIKSPVDVVNPTIIRIVTDLNDKILFASRGIIPFPKSAVDFQYYKTVGIYAYPRSVLIDYKNLKIGPLEKIEEHDIVRLLENGIPIYAYPYNTETISVDTLKDLDRVRIIVFNSLNGSN